MSGWGLWRRQALAVMRLDLRKNFLGRRSILITLLALMPVALLAARAVALLAFEQPDRGEGPRLADDLSVFAMIYQGFILRFVVFFGSVAIFTNLSRGDVLDKSLHYWVLTPVRREVVVAGKYLAGLGVAWTLFTLSTVGSLAMLYAPMGTEQAMRHLSQGPGLSHAGAYVLVTVLGCLGYGALFLAIGLFFKNPIVPALGILAWESGSFLFPAFLKKLTVVHYLQALCPVAVNQGPFALIAEPPAVWVAIPGLLVLTAALLWVSGIGIRRMEVSYGSD
jgi:ABC-type Na+ efflux pump permease subunit